MLDQISYSPPPGRYDEAISADGVLRDTWVKLGTTLAQLAHGELRERQRRAERLLDAEGSGHLVHELTAGSGGSLSRPWLLDPIPVVMSQSEFGALGAAVVQRVHLLEAVLADLYSHRSLVSEGIIPASIVFGLTGMRTSAATRSPGRWIVHYSVDLVRVASGEWRIVQDLVDAPSGLGYALLNRTVIARIVPDEYRDANVAPIAEFSTTLRQALTAHSPAGRRSPRVVVLTGGPGHPTYVEQSYLAMRMGYHLVEGGDLVVRKNHVWLRSLDGLEPVDVVYRRLEDGALDPLEPHITGAHGVPAITWAAQYGGVALANAFGARVVEEAALAPYLPAAAVALLGESLLLDRVGHGELLATTPTYVGGRLDAVVPGQVVLRFQAVAGPDGITVMPGGVGRVLAAGDDPAKPTVQLAKDLWVVGGAAIPPRVHVPHATLPQVDFGSSIPKRAAEALFWMARAAERAEYLARALHAIGGRSREDPSLMSLSGGGWARGALALLRSSRGLLVADNEALYGSLPFGERLSDEMLSAQTSLAAQIAALVQEATSVREFLSVTTGRVLGRLTRVRADLLGPSAAADDLDIVLVDLAALAGLAMESTVRGPAWRFLDLGRRLERALLLLGSIEATVGIAVEGLALQPLIESTLQVNESLVAYRRQYRSDVELSAVMELLVHDDSNPRSLMFQLDRIREHVSSLAWPEGSDLVQAASLGALVPLESAVASGRRLSVDAVVLGARGPLLDLAGAIVARWFADPVNPVALGAT